MPRMVVHTQRSETCKVQMHDGDLHCVWARQLKIYEKACQRVADFQLGFALLDTRRSPEIISCRDVIGQSDFPLSTRNPCILLNSRGLHHFMPAVPRAGTRLRKIRQASTPGQFIGRDIQLDQIAQSRKDTMDAQCIKGLPSAGYYIPNFISTDEEEKILINIYRQPPRKWTILSHRRLLSLPSTLTAPAKDTLLAMSLPGFLVEPILPRFESLDIFADSPHLGPNQVIVNEYQPGKGIMPHEDGAAYHPITATLSLGGHTVLEIYKKTDNGERETEPTWRILQEPRSLLVTTGAMYKETLHGISDLEVDHNLRPETIVNWSLLADANAFETGTAERQVRVSLTYRDVLKVAKLGGALKFMNKP